MTDLHKAATMALEALESCTPGDYSTGHVIHPSFDENAVDDAIAALREALAAPVVPPGYALVPVEPTPEMAKAGHYRFCAEFAQDYRAMLAAAPKPKEQT